MIQSMSFNKKASETVKENKILEGSRSSRKEDKWNKDRANATKK